VKHSINFKYKSMEKELILPKNKIHKTPRLLMADAYTVGSNKFESDLVKQKSTYYNVFRKQLITIDPTIYTADDNRIIFGGLQIILEKLFFEPITHEEIDEAKEFLKTFKVGPRGLSEYEFPEEIWRRVVDEFNGRPPIKIKALPEGSVCYPNEPNMQIVCDIDGMGVLAAWFESKLLQTWAVSEKITQNEHWMLKLKSMVRMVYPNIEEEKAIFLASIMLTDFGDRAGITAEESEVLGMAQLYTFPGTDTCSGAYQAWKNASEQPIGNSVNALAHRNVQGYEFENDCYEAIYNSCTDGSFISMVADCNDYFVAVEQMLLPLAKLSETLKNDKIVVARPDCYSDDTLILSNDGWVLFKDLTDETLVAQVLDDGSYEFIQPLKKQIYDYNGEMCHFSGNKGKVDLLVTPEHKMIYKKNNKFLSQYAKEVGNIGYHGKYMVRSAKVKETNKRLTNFERFLIAFQADGSFTSKHERVNEGLISGKKVYRFNFTKKRKRDKLIEICENGGFEYSEKIEPKRPNNYTIYIWLDISINVTKNFEWVDLTSLSLTWCKQFIDELSNWDSCVRNENKIKFDTTNKEIVYIVELIVLSCGYGCLISEYEDTRSDKFNNVWTLHITRNNLIGGQSIKKNNINYVGKVYCVQVPSGKIMVKRNRSTMVCGNSGDALEQVSWTIELAIKNNLCTTEIIDGKTWYFGTTLRFIEGDGMTHKNMWDIMMAMIEKGYAPFAWGLFGQGGGGRNGLKRDNLSAKYALAAMGFANIGVVKFSETLGKTTLPGPFKVLRSPEALSKKTTIVFENEMGEDAMVLYFDGTNLNKPFGPGQDDDFIQIRRRIKEQMANMPKCLNRGDNYYPASEAILDERLRLLSVYAPNKDSNNY